MQDGCRSAVTVQDGSDGCRTGGRAGIPLVVVWYPHSSSRYTSSPALRVHQPATAPGMAVSTAPGVVAVSRSRALGSTFLTQPG